jgi:amino acid transporter
MREGKRETYAKHYSKSLYAGILLTMLGVITIMEANTYPIGNLSHMGPGFFPAALGIILALLGVLVGVVGDSEQDGEETPEIKKSLRTRARGMLCIVAGMLAFMVLGQYGGLVPATFALVFIASMGDTEHSLKTALILALGTTIVGTLIFSWALQLQLPMFRWG